MCCPHQTPRTPCPSSPRWKSTSHAQQSLARSSSNPTCRYGSRRPDVVGAAALFSHLTASPAHPLATHTAGEPLSAHAVDLHRTHCTVPQAAVEASMLEEERRKVESTKPEGQLSKSARRRAKQKAKMTLQEFNAVPLTRAHAERQSRELLGFEVVGSGGGSASGGGGGGGRGVGAGRGAGGGAAPPGLPRSSPVQTAGHRAAAATSRGDSGRAAAAAASRPAPAIAAVPVPSPAPAPAVATAPAVDDPVSLLEQVRGRASPRCVPCAASKPSVDHAHATAHYWPPCVSCAASEPFPCCTETPAACGEGR